MRSFFKGLRKSLKAACLTATLATCWQLGQPAEVMAEPVQVQISGTVSPGIQVTDLFFIYGTGYSSFIESYSTVKLGDFASGQATPFLALDTVKSEREFFWFVAGLYGDISGGQYVEGLNGVTLGINASEGDSWASSISIDEEVLFGYLLNDESEKLPEYSGNWLGWHVDFDSYLKMSGTSTLFNFSNASSNGIITVSTEIVPEPLTMILFGAGGLYVLHRRRESH